MTENNDFNNIENDSTNSRNEKCFELVLNSNGQWDIIDHKESKEKGAVCIYNDLGVAPFSAAPSLCDLLNDLSGTLDDVIDTNNLGYEVAKHLKEENEQLKKQLKSKERLIGAYEQFINDLKEDDVLDD